MVTKVEMHKKMIKTVITQLPRYIQLYLPNDQVLLNEFLELIKHFEDADIKRTSLIHQLSDYNQRLYRTDKYLHTPFLWFSEDYFQKARLMLSLTGFHAEEFYEYLAKHLRRSTTNLGVFELVRKNTPLTDQVWEQLQLDSNKLLIPLTEKELQIIDTVYETIRKLKIHSLNGKQIKTPLYNHFPKKSRMMKDIKNFFLRIEARWFLTFQSTAFGIERIFFHLKLNKTRSFKEIINFQDSNNTILTLSDIYQVKDNRNEYLGIMHVPSRDVNRLERYLEKKGKNEKLIIKTITPIITTYRSISLKKYIATNGWSEINSKEKKHLKQTFKTHKNQQENSITYITPPFNLDWHFREHPLPMQLIKLYCDIQPEFVFPELPLGTKSNKDSKNLSNDDIGLLKQLSYNNVVQVGFIPWRLIYEYSLDLFWIILPKIPMNQLIKLLEFFPRSEVYVSKENVHLWVRSNRNTIHWIRKTLKWEIYQISRTHFSHPLDFHWFNTQEMEWKTPLNLCHF